MTLTHSPIGIDIGNDIYEAQKAAGAAFLRSLNGKLPTEAQAAAFARQVVQLSGDATTSHVPGWVAVPYDPSEHGLDLPQPSIASQLNPDGGGYTCAVWWKNGVHPKDWALLAGVTSRPSSCVPGTFYITTHNNSRLALPADWQDGWTVDNSVYCQVASADGWVQSGLRPSRRIGLARWPGAMCTLRLQVRADAVTAASAVRVLVERRRAGQTDVPLNGEGTVFDVTSTDPTQVEASFSMPETLGGTDDELRLTFSMSTSSATPVLVYAIVDNLEWARLETALPMVPLSSRTPLPPIAGGSAGNTERGRPPLGDEHQHRPEPVSAEPPLTEVAGGDPGTQTEGTLKSAWNHRHPKPKPPDPTVEGTKLYTAAIPGTASQLAVAILAPMQRWLNVDVWGFGYLQLWDTPPYYSAWRETSTPGTWRMINQGHMGTTYTDGVAPFVGMRILIPSDYQNEEVAHPSVGIYVVDSVGSETEYAQISRAADADASADFIEGKIVCVAQGASASGHTFLYGGPERPALGTDAILFVDHGPASIYWDTYRFGFGTRWTAVEGVSTWRSSGDTYEGVGWFPPLPLRWLGTDGNPTGAPAVGDQFLVWDETDPYGEDPHFGLYELQAQSLDGTIIVIRRVPAANTAATLTGLIARITGTGVAHAGDYFHETATVATLDTSATAWTVGSSDPAPPTRALLTNSQLSTEGASTETLTKVTTFTGSHPGGMIFDTPFLTLVGTPTFSALPAGRQKFQAGAVRLVGWDPVANPGTTQIRFALYKYNGVDVADIIIDSTCGIPLTNEWQSVAWEVDTSLIDISGCRLELLPLLVSDCGSGVTVEFEYNSTFRRTWWQIPGVSFPLGGTDDHQALRRRDQDVASADPVKADPCHPWSAVSDDYGTGTGTDGLLLLPGLTKWPDHKARRCRCALAGTQLVGIDATGLRDGDPVEVFVTGGTRAAPKTILHNNGGGAVAAPYLPIYLPGIAIGGGFQAQADVKLNGPAVCCFMYDAVTGVFRFLRTTVYAT
jgi:hypothetical protein